MTKDDIKNFLVEAESLGEKIVLEAIAEYFEEEWDGLELAAKIIRRGSDPDASKACLEDKFYEEGSTSIGHIPLSILLEQLAEIYNLTEWNDIEKVAFTGVVRLANEEEKEEQGATCDEWFVVDEKIKLGEILIGFEV